MGIYNCEDTLQASLDSLYSQTFQDFDVILYDDGSTDGTRKVAQRNAELHGNVHLIECDENHGLCYALNSCLKVADGQYIARMDGDDLSVPERFEIESRWLDEHSDYAFVSCPIIYYRNGKEYMRGRTTKHEPELKDFAVSSPFCHAPVMVRKEAYDAIGGYCEDWYCNQMEDYYLWMQFYQHGFRGYTLSQQLYIVCDEDASTSRRNFKRRVNETVVKWKVCRAFCLPIYSYLYCLQPLVLWALPTPIYMWLHKRRMRSISS